MTPFGYSMVTKSSCLHIKLGLCITLQDMLHQLVHLWTIGNVELVTWELTVFVCAWGLRQQVVDLGSTRHKVSSTDFTWLLQHMQHMPFLPLQSLGRKDMIGKSLHGLCVVDQKLCFGLHTFLIFFHRWEVSIVSCVNVKSKKTSLLYLWGWSLVSPTGGNNVLNKC